MIWTKKWNAITACVSLICETSLLKHARKNLDPANEEQTRFNSPFAQLIPLHNPGMWQRKGCKMTEATWRLHWLPISNKNTPVQSWVLPLLAQPLQGFPTMFFWRSSRVPRTRCSACLANFSHILPWARKDGECGFSTGNFYGPLPMTPWHYIGGLYWIPCPRTNQQERCRNRSSD